MEIKEILEHCDRKIAEIRVSGDDVYKIVKARELLKLAYDEILKGACDETTLPKKCE